ncbi:hypothetical protein [Burkholderia cenocepacia]|uniref:hypothetical protein n=1 Tax=Burkholderia cenocepacia TaxID=95486 RepID=UPI002ABD4543|nr:hypothetical protein [Burkholderia cenocepacia]
MARSYNVRCSREKCKLRYVFAKHPDDYKRPRKCAGCKGTKFRIIPNMAADRGKHTLCTCGGYKWGDNYTASRPPHRMGSPACWYRADGSQRLPGDADFVGEIDQDSELLEVMP